MPPTLDRNVSSVQRWEKEEGLPVHRHLHHKQASVYAYRSEIDAWIENRSTALENDRPGRLSKFLAKRKMVARVTSGSVLLLLAGLIIWVVPDSSPNAGGLNFQQRDWVLIADFENRTGETVFDGVLEYALEGEISNSQFVNVVPRERIEDTLRLMRKPLDTLIDRTLGREICLRDGGIKALLTGRVEKLDSTYLLSVQLVDPSQGQTLASAGEEAAGQKQVLSAIRSLSNWARENLGEKLALIQESERKLEEVATPSLRAVQLFTEARTLFDRGLRGQGPAEQLLRQALEIDSEFASAYIWLAWTLKNQRESSGDYIQHAEQAFQLVGTTSEQERYFILGSYYWMKGELDRAIHAFEALLGLYPDHFWATHKLAELYRQTGQEKQALTYQLRRSDIRPHDLFSSYTAARQLALLTGDWARAKPYAQRAVNLLTPESIEANPRPAAWLTLFPAYEPLLRGDPQTALIEANRGLQTLKDSGVLGRDRDAGGHFYLMLGRLQQAQASFEKNVDDDSRRYYFLAAAAYVKEDHETLRKHLKQFLETPEVRSGAFPATLQISQTSIAIMLARTGYLSEAEELLPSPTRAWNASSVAGEIELVQGVVALSRGNKTQGMTLLEHALPLVRRQPSDLFLMGSEILAETWRQQGELSNAARVLESASKERSWVMDHFVLLGPLWLRIRARLAQLYREMGRHIDAGTIEEDLRKRLALADADHPILRELK